jgi:hypothetical protein
MLQNYLLFSLTIKYPFIKGLRIHKLRRKVNMNELDYEGWKDDLKIVLEVMDERQLEAFSKIMQVKVVQALFGISPPDSDNAGEAQISES